MHVHESQAFEPNYAQYNGLFNATWTFKHNSDIWTNYSHVAGGGLFQKLKQSNIIIINTNFAAKKNKLVAWFVSQCNPSAVTSGRMNYVRNLQKYIPVDLYKRIISKCQLHEYGW